MKRMLLGLLTASALFLGACSDSGGDKPAPGGEGVKLSKQELSLTSDAAVETVEVEAAGDWGVVSKDTSWCTVTPSGGVAGMIIP